MTITRPREKTRSLLVLGLLLSILIHVTGGALWHWLSPVLTRIVPKPVRMASLQEPPPAESDVIHLEHRAPAPARPAHENRPVTVAVRPHPVATLAPAPLPKHELARSAPHAPAQPPAARAATAFIPVPHHVRPVVVAPAPDTKPAISDRQIAQMGVDFSKAIAESRESLAGVQAETERNPVQTVKHYTVHYVGIHEGMNPGDGEIYEVSKQRIGNTVWYYTRYTYIHSDGTYEADSIPWPFHYPVDDDPFARGDHRIPLQPPPAGFKPDRPLKPILAQYFGGPEVTD